MFLAAFATTSIAVESSPRLLAQAGLEVLMLRESLSARCMFLHL
ncbi:hypothetical protein HMPREF9057_01777 [Actinomyces sp. oral taxon 171 str. F0337]|nr:hypothetical protein HMPREF9057_01777 [Actinomyces sp. oral taxon 171 str. F0337]